MTTTTTPTATLTATVVNLTPHDVNVVVGDDVLTLPKSGTVARVASTSVHVGNLNGVVPLFATTFGDVTGLPDPVPGTVFLVSGLVKAAVPGRADVLAPADLVRDDAGNVKGCKGLNT